ncbi:hypothetical protein K488DRAFT_67534 [Vararia minispora EC-137]|uniref:Uncharacterized protein n=1 Tax=Vararia minispora EC-137 TaxID=1314806 RepID=A0ACB8QXF7_9AGAM|nr:hypothetical protein K488DRAFT_67534 [Vararia minispora EC-137]
MSAPAPAPAAGPAAASSSVDSRIVVLAPRADQARDLVARIKSLAGPAPSSSSIAHDDLVHWTISNKYYSAAVHFRLITLAECTASALAGVPALILVSPRGEPYAQHVLNIAHHVQAAEPEVVLAVATGTAPPHADDPPEGPDAFFAEHGFEFVDAERGLLSSTGDRDDDDDDDADDGIAGLERVIDALSTIMWPSMTRSAAMQRAPTLSQQIAMLDEADLDVLREHPGADDDALGAGMTEEDALAALVADQAVPLAPAHRRAVEMAALERWLVENEELHERELGIEQDQDRDGRDSEDRAARADPIWTPRTATPGPSGDTHHYHHAFDDDFSAFVSAPPAIAISTSPPHPQSPAHAAAPFDSPQLLRPVPTGGSFRSVSSFGTDEPLDDAQGWVALNDSALELGRFDEYEIDAAVRAHEGELDVRDARGAFDLVEVLGALASVRADVAGIGDESARRDAAAKFASEFVFGRMDGEA